MILYHFLVSSTSSQNVREESISSVTEETRFLPSEEETCQHCFEFLQIFLRSRCYFLLLLISTYMKVYKWGIPRTTDFELRCSWGLLTSVFVSCVGDALSNSCLLLLEVENTILRRVVTMNVYRFVVPLNHFFLSVWWMGIVLMMAWRQSIIYYCVLRVITTFDWSLLLVS